LPLPERESILKNSLDNNHFQNRHRFPLPPSHDTIRAPSTSSKKEDDMCNQPMKEKLHALKLQGMTKHWSIRTDEATRGLTSSIAWRCSSIKQWNWRQNQALTRPRSLLLAYGELPASRTSLSWPSED